MWRTCPVLTLLVFLSSAKAEEVPPPSQTPCKVIVHGRTSTLDSIVVKKVGQNVPRIYRGPHVCKNSAGFDWYVSQHFALKSNVGDELAREFLVLAELAYPHYVEVIGQEPPGIEETRLAMVHATNLDTLQKAVIDDIGNRWAGNGGGVTLPHSFAAYNYPSGSLRYHRHDLSLHEGLHLFQLTTQQGMFTPLRFTEGITYPFANHVYDPAKKQLTVAVFDKAPINNPMDSGLRQMRSKGVLSLEDLMREKVPKEYGHNARALFTAFFWSDQERLMKWRLWRDEMFRLGNDPRARDLDLKLIAELSGGTLERLDTEWREWLARRQTTFTHVDWGWEQWGDTLQSYGWPWNKELYAQMDINLPLGKKLRPDPLRLDYPRSPRPPIVGKVELGGEVPAVGCVLDFSQAESPPGQPRGWAGLGLGVQGRKLMRVVIEENRKLILDGQALGLSSGRKEVPFPAELLAVAHKQRRVGLTIQITRDAVVATVRAGTEGNFKELAASYPITTEERQELLKRHLAALSRDARHLITPFVEETASPTEDLSRPSPANRWQFAGDQETYRLYRASWRLGKRAPQSLLLLRDRMLAAMNKDPETQRQALAHYRDSFGQVVKDVAAIQSAEASLALNELSGVVLEVCLSGDPMAAKPTLVMLLRGRSEGKVSGTVSGICRAEGKAIASLGESRVEAEPGKQASVSWDVDVPRETREFRVTVTAHLRWHGVPLTVQETRKVQNQKRWFVERTMGEEGGP